MKRSESESKLFQTVSRSTIEIPRRGWPAERTAEPFQIEIGVTN